MPNHDRLRQSMFLALLPLISLLLVLGLGACGRSSDSETSSQGQNPALEGQSTPVADTANLVESSGSTPPVGQSEGSGDGLSEDASEAVSNSAPMGDPTELPTAIAHPATMDETQIRVERLAMQAGTDAQEVVGHLAPGERVRYLFDGQAGQDLSLQLITPMSGELVFQLMALGEHLLGQSEDEWAGMLPADGEYAIDIIALAGRPEKVFSLKILLSGADDAPDAFAEEPSAPEPILLMREIKPLGLLEFKFSEEAVQPAGVRSIIEISGPNNFAQRIQAPPHHDANDVDAPVLVVEDMNADGLQDFRLLEYLPAGANLPYHYFIFDPASSSFVHDRRFSNITSPEFIGSDEIRSSWRGNAAHWGQDTYRIVDGGPVLERREQWEALDDVQARHWIIEFDRQSGAENIVLDESMALSDLP